MRHMVFVQNELTSVNFAFFLPDFVGKYTGTGQEAIFTM